MRKKKSNNSKKIIFGLVIALAAIAVLLVFLSILEESDFQFGSNDANDDYNEVIDYDDDDNDNDNDGNDNDGNDNDGNDNDGNDNDDNDDDAAVESTRLVYVGNEEMYEILNDTSGEGFFVYIGRPTCPHCIAFEPTLEETLQYLDQELRYFQIDLAAEADDESEMTMAEILGELGVAGVPRIVYIENGVAIDALSGNQAQEYVLEFFEENGGLN